jgi:nitrogen regulatory protein P-II 1
VKRIEAIIRPERALAVKEALLEMGHAGMTLCDVQGHGTQKGISQQWRGHEYSVDLLPKTSLVVVVHDHAAQDVVDMIVRTARTDRIGDGKIFVTPVEQVIRVRTGESGAEAL